VLHRPVEPTIEMRQMTVVIVIPCLVFVAVAVNRSGGFAWYGWPALIAGTVCAFAMIHYASEIVQSSRLAAVTISNQTRMLIAVAACVALLATALAVHRVTEGRSTQLFDWTAPEFLMDQTLNDIQQNIDPDERIAGTSVGLL
jgi:hypothetical protein